MTLLAIVYSNGNQFAMQIPTYPKTGLQLLCNRMKDSEYWDVDMNHSTPYNVPPTIRSPQGSITTSTGNNFTHSSPVLVGGIIHCSWKYAIDNYYISNYETYATAPFLVYNKMARAGNECALRPYQVTPDFQARQLLIRDFTDAKTDWQTQAALLTNLIDGGGTADLLASISESGDGTTLYDQLSQHTPYLSATVLKAAAVSQKIPDNMMRTLLANHPEVLRGTDCLPYLHQQLPALYSEDDVTTMRQNAVDNTARTETEANIMDAMDRMQYTHNELVTAIKSDTTGLDQDTLIYWCDQMPDRWSRYETANIYIDRGDFGSANSTLAGIPTEFDLSDSSAFHEHTSYMDLFSLVMNVKSAGRTMDSLTDAEMATLKDISDRNHGGATYAALALYQHNAQIEPYVCPDSTGPNANTARRAAPNAATDAKSTCKAFPNPAHDLVNFAYSLPQASGQLKLTVVNIHGVKIHEVALADPSGTIDWNTHAVPAGNYIYTIRSEAKVLLSGKLVIVH